VTVNLEHRDYFNPEHEQRYEYADLEDKTGIYTLINLTIAGDREALYSLNIPSLSGQLAMGTQI